MLADLRPAALLAVALVLAVRAYPGTPALLALVPNAPVRTSQPSCLHTTALGRRRAQAAAALHAFALEHAVLARPALPRSLRLCLPVYLPCSPLLRPHFKFPPPPRAAASPTLLLLASRRCLRALRERPPDRLAVRAGLGAVWALLFDPPVPALRDVERQQLGALLGLRASLLRPFPFPFPRRFPLAVFAVRAVRAVLSPAAAGCVGRVLSRHAPLPRHRSRHRASASDGGRRRQSEVLQHPRRQARPAVLHGNTMRAGLQRAEAVLLGM
eukprot:3013282-Rhodomonas_salina.1